MIIGNKTFKVDLTIEENTLNCELINIPIDFDIDLCKEQITISCASIKSHSKFGFFNGLFVFRYYKEKRYYKHTFESKEELYEVLKKLIVLISEINNYRIVYPKIEEVIECPECKNINPSSLKMKNRDEFKIVFNCDQCYCVFQYRIKSND